MLEQGRDGHRGLRFYSIVTPAAFLLLAQTLGFCKAEPRPVIAPFTRTDCGNGDLKTHFLKNNSGESAANIQIRLIRSGTTPLSEAERAAQEGKYDVAANNLRADLSLTEHQKAEVLARAFDKSAENASLTASDPTMNPQVREVMQASEECSKATARALRAANP